MKKGKRLAIFGCALLVLVGAIVSIPALRNAGVLPQEEVSVSSVQRSYIDKEVLISHSRQDIEKIRIQNESLTFTLVSVLNPVDEEGTTFLQDWYIEEYPDWPLTVGAETSISTLGTDIQRTFKVADSKDDVDLDNFGLKNPTSQIDVDYVDGSDATIYVGNTTPDGAYRYAMLDGDDAIYTVYTSVATYSQYTMADLLDCSINDICVDEQLNSLLLEKRGERSIEIVRIDEDYEDPRVGMYDYSSYRWVQPYENPEAIVSSQIYQLFNNMESAKVVSYADGGVSDEKLAEYGVADDDFEYHVKLQTEVVETDDSSSDTTVSAKTVGYKTNVDYYFGKDAGDGLIYFRQGGTEFVYTVEASVVDSFNFDAYSYLSKLCYLNRMEETQSYSVKVGSTGEEFKIDLLREDTEPVTDSEDSQVIKQVFYLNGKLVDEDKAMVYFQDMIGIMHDYEIGEEAPEYDKTDYITVNLTQTDGYEHNATFYRMNEFYYAVKFGNVWVACSSSQIDTLLTELRAELE